MLFDDSKNTKPTPAQTPAPDDDIWGDKDPVIAAPQPTSLVAEATPAAVGGDDIWKDNEPKIAAQPVVAEHAPLTNAAPDDSIWGDDKQPSAITAQATASPEPAANNIWGDAPRITPPDIREVAARVGKNIQQALSAEEQDQAKWDAFVQQAQQAKPTTEKDFEGLSMSRLDRFGNGMVDRMEGPVGRINTFLEQFESSSGKGPNGQGRGANSLSSGKPPATPSGDNALQSSDKKGPSR